MAKRKEPKVGDRGILRVREPGETGVEYYSTRIEDVRDGLIACSQPMRGQVYVKILSSPVELTYLKGDSVFSLMCEVIEQGKGDPPLIVLKPISSIYRSDRREYVRVPWMLDAELLFVKTFPADVKKLPWSSRTLRNMLWPYVMKKAWLLPSWSLKVLDGWLSGSKMRHVGIMYPW